MTEKIRLNTFVDEKTAEEIKIIAVKEKTTTSKLIAKLINKEIKNRKNED